MHTGWKKKSPPELITAEEITAIMEEAGDTEDICRARAIALAYKPKEKHAKAILSICFEMFDFACLLSNVYQAGRVQGIREERQKRRAGA